jgi:MarR family transcriptional regulator, transcriptional regulator for hemolysin
LEGNDSYTLMQEPVGRKMDKIGRMFQVKLQEKLRHLDIDRSFYPLLLIEAGNGITQQELAGKLRCDKVQVVRIIDYLSSNGYVERVQSRNDKRKYELAITEKAAQLIPDIKNVLDETTILSFKGLSENQVEEFYNTLNKIENNLLSK